MAQLTVREVDEILHAALKREAKKRGQSLNKYIVQLLKTSLGLGQMNDRPREYDDLDHLAGTWTKAESEAFERHVQSQRQVDEGLWQ